MGTQAHLIPPVFVVGGTRSGTSMLGRELGKAPGMAYWHEPNTLWRIGHAYREHDRATVEDAKPWVRKRVRRAMLRFQQSNDGRRVVEKSPYNPVRVGYLHAIFPEGKIVHIYRDGRAMLRSQFERLDNFRPYELTAQGRPAYLMRRLGMTPWWEWPAYFPRFAEGIWRRYVIRKPTRWFGLRYEGWKDDLKRGLDRVEIVSKQWTYSMGCALADFETLPSESYMTLRYEDVAREPSVQLRRICEFCGIEPNEAFLAQMDKDIHPGSVDKWKRELDPETIRRASEFMRPMLERLGYPVEIELPSNETTAASDERASSSQSVGATRPAQA